MIETPTLVDAPTQLVAMVHIETLRSKMQQVMGPSFGEVMAAVKAQGIGPSGPWFTHHLKITPAGFDFDICVPVSSPVSPVGRVTSWQRPALKLVRTFFHGPYEGLGAAWNEFGKWAQAKRYKTADDLYECYVVGPETSSDPATWRTELSRPVIE